LIKYVTSNSNDEINYKKNLLIAEKSISNLQNMFDAILDFFLSKSEYINIHNYSILKFFN